ncbi:NAD(P)H-dependent oxidoreductase [Paenibacillus sp. ACRRY]|uniref:NAD(P)H-dependent oxidoreductase n=1 Tax=Paenibacillus sp. ACRRY TaxID=2918208 RepID=UPI001EF69B88|nr:NAD(P)H-dependent oxidoreductase [Paenibacillus sp. ACRRY]MCG7384502.1 NAD(P)H-dependent oxidoreductase [Paenibacillus sp. ACRRY]
MNVVIIYAHPYDGSFCKGLLETIVPTLEARGANIKVKDLVKMNFDPVMRPEDLRAAKTKVYTEAVKAEQDDILWADAIITIAPVWFGMIPGFLKGYFDKVFITGFAYDQGLGLLSGKRVFSLFTFGANDPYIELVNQYRTLEYLWDNIFGMVGFDDIATKYFTRVPTSSDELRQQYLVEASAFVNQIFDRKLGEIGQLGHARLLTHLTAKGHLNEKFN